MAALLYTLLFLGICSINARSVEKQRHGPIRTPMHARTSPRNPVGWIIGGNKATEGEFPYQVSMQYFGSHYCGASIISNNYILTAAHCVEGYDSFPYDRLVVGKTNLANSGGKELEFGKVTMHPNYNTYTYDHDFAVIKLKDPLVYTDKIQPVDLPPLNTCGYLDESTPVVVSGWGLIDADNGDVVDDLYKVTVKVANRAKCNKAYDGDITEAMLCASDTQKDSCQGDSGGPMVTGSKPVQYGVVSWGIGCADPGYDGVYSRICHVRQWLKDTTGV